MALREPSPAEVMATYPLTLSTALDVSPASIPQGRHAAWSEPPRTTWALRPVLVRPDGERRPAGEGDGAAEALVDVIRHRVSPPVPGFDVVRLVPPPEATGERQLTVDQTNQSVVVGERVVVKWMRELVDSEHPGALTLAHLDAVNFMGVPATHGMLLWRGPSGHAIPCAVVSGYLPRSRDGWEWCVDAAAQAMGLAAAADLPSLSSLQTGALPQVDPWLHDFPARLGRLAAKLHLALATPSKVIPEPVHRVDLPVVRRWHGAARATLEAATEACRTLDGGEAVMAPRQERIAEAIDTLLAVDDGTLIQRIHADLHVGQILRWSGGLAVIDFDGNPVVESPEQGTPPASGRLPSVQPAARDVAQLLRSLDHVARIVDKRTGFGHRDAADTWSAGARSQCLAAYRSELAAAGHPELLDERLVAAFEAEQVCRELVYAARHLRRWAYAPLNSLPQMFP